MHAQAQSYITRTLGRTVFRTRGDAEDHQSMFGGNAGEDECDYATAVVCVPGGFAVRVED